MNKSIVVLGRGISLEKLKDFKEEVNTVILCNSFFTKNVSKWSHNKAYWEDELIDNFLRDKDIYMVCSPNQNFPKSELDNFFKRYNVVKSYFTLFPKYKRVGKGNDIFGLMPDSVFTKYLEIDNLKIKKKGDAIPATLAYGVLLATEELKGSNIHIFGQDFYEKDYYISHNINKSKASEYSQESITNLKNDITNFLNYLNDCTFYIYTCANYNPISNNIKVIS